MSSWYLNGNCMKHREELAKFAEPWPKPQSNSIYIQEVWCVSLLRNAFSWMKMFEFRWKCHWTLFLRAISHNNKSSLVYWEFSWWRHQMEAFSALLALCAGNSPVTGEFPSQRPVTRSFGVFFDLRLNKPFSKRSWGWWFETPSRSLWRHCDVRRARQANWRALS